jgi:hypothetical protein
MENVPRFNFLRFKPQKIEPGLDMVSKLVGNCNTWFLAKIYFLIEWIKGYVFKKGLFNLIGFGVNDERRF